MTDRGLPSDFSELAIFKERLGTLQLGTRAQPACLWTMATGYIGPTLLRRELEAAEAFGRQHTDGWSYVVDTREVRAINPVNPLLLRRIPRLPGLAAYVVIAPAWIRVVARIARAVVRPTAVVSSRSEALEAAAVPHEQSSL